MTKAKPASKAGQKKYDPVVPSNLTKAQVEAFVEKLRKTLGENEVPPRKEIASFVSELGGSLLYVPSSSPRLRPAEPELEQNAASVMIHGADDPSAEKFRIFVGSDASYERDRFSVAHELGHVYLHSQKSVNSPLPEGSIGARRVMAGRPDFGASTNRSEWEANWFAAELLMPREEIRKLHKKFGGRGEQFMALLIAQTYCVSRGAAAVRIQDLRGRGLIT